MIASRGLIACRLLSRPVICNANKLIVGQTIRNSGSYVFFSLNLPRLCSYYIILLFWGNFIRWSYRVSAHHRPHVNIVADIVGGIMWWWILWHVYHDYGHIIVSLFYINFR